MRVQAYAAGAPVNTIASRNQLVSDNCFSLLDFSKTVLAASLKYCSLDLERADADNLRHTKQLPPVNSKPYEQHLSAIKRHIYDMSAFVRWMQQQRIMMAGTFLGSAPTSSVQCC